MTTATVVDASVAVKWVLPEAHTDRAHALMANSIQARQRLVGTPHLIIEVVNAIYQHRRRGAPHERLSEAEADQALARFLAFPLELLGLTTLYQQAFAFARTHRLSNVYDTIVTEGWNTRDPSGQPQGRGALFRQHADHRPDEHSLSHQISSEVSATPESNALRPPRRERSGRRKQDSPRAP